MFTKYIISNDPGFYEGWPDLALTPSGKLICVFSECVAHGDRSYTRIVMTSSCDQGCSWSKKNAITESTAGLEYYYNCARITQLRNGSLCIIVDKIPSGGENNADAAINLLYFSQDEGNTWSRPLETPLKGIVPDKLLELSDKRWIISAHHPEDGFLTQFLRYSDDFGKTWSDRVTVGKKNGLNLCEASIIPVDKTTLVAFMRENSLNGLDCMKTISYDRGETWSEVINFPLPGCHRPVAGFLHDKRILITYRFCQGGKGWLGNWTQNFFAAITDSESARALTRGEAWTRIIPVDYDRSPKSDLGYSGWIQFSDGGVYIVNYIVDGNRKAHIRGYNMSELPA